jgi:hypothetical protein
LPEERLAEKCPGGPQTEMRNVLPKDGEKGKPNQRGQVSIFNKKVKC